MANDTCPTCNGPLQSIQEAAQNPQLSPEVRAQLQVSLPPQPRQAGGLGCTTLALSFAIALAAAVIIGTISEFTIGTDFPAQGMRRGEAGIFSGIGTFIIVMISLFSIFVYRQARNDAVLKTQLAAWHSARGAATHDQFCPNCQKRIVAPQPPTPEEQP